MERELNVDWSTFKEFVDSRNISIQYVDFRNIYHLKAYDGVFYLSCKLNRNIPELSSDINDFETNYKPSGNKKLDPRTEDNRQLMAVNRVPAGYSLYVTGAADDISTATFGTGDSLKFDSNNPIKEFQLLNHYYVIGARGIWESADHDNFFDAILYAPASTGLIQQTGDFTKVEVATGKNIIVPTAAGAGDWDIDINAKHPGTNVLKCVPVPSTGNNGYFDYNKDSNILSVNSTQSGGYNLYDFDIDIHAFGRKVWGRSSPGSTSNLDVGDLVGKLIYNFWKVKFEFQLEGGLLQVDDEASIVVIVATKQNI